MLQTVLATHAPTSGLAQYPRAVSSDCQSSARLRPWDRGFICGMRRANAPRKVIQKDVKKSDGTHPTLRAVDAVLANEKRDPEYVGEDSRAGGRPRAISPAQAKPRGIR